MCLGMIADLFGIYRARHDRAAATKLAAKFAQGQVLDRVTAPLLLPLILLWVAIVVCALLVALSIWGYAALHGSVLMLGVIPAAIGYLAFRIQAGLRMGMSRVQTIAETYTDKGLDSILPSKADDDLALPPGTEPES